MKTIIKICLALIISHGLMGQSPDLFNYQGMAFDGNGDPVSNQNIAIRLSILANAPNGVSVYEEEHQVVTSDNGIFSVQIGNGNIISGQFSAIGWGQNTFWISTALDLNNQGYQQLGVQQLVSVPYALHASTVANSDDADADPNNEIQSLNLNGNQLSLSGSNSITLPTGTGGLDEDPSNELQTISRNGNMIELSQNGGSVVDQTEDADADPSNEIQSLSSQQTGNEVVLSITDGQSTQFSVADNDNDASNEIQNLNLVGNQLSLSGANTITLPSGTGGLDEDPGNEIQTIFKVGNMIELSQGGGSVIDDVDDADADPNNELQSLSLNGNILSLSQGNNINLGDFESPWQYDSNMLGGIFYDGGYVSVKDNESQVDITPFGLFGYSQIYPESFYLRSDESGFSNLNTSVISYTNSESFVVEDISNNQSSVQTVAGFGSYAPDCQAEMQAGIVAIQDTLGLANTFYSKDSLYYYGSVGGLAFPDVAVLKPTHIQFETLGNGLKSTLGPGAQYNYSDNFRSSLISDELRIEETSQTIPFDRVFLNGDGLKLTNSAKWQTAEITSDNTFGGSLKLNNPSGIPLVHLGPNPDTLLGNIPTGNLFLNNEIGDARISMHVFNNEGICMNEGDSTYVFTGLGGVTTGFLERGLVDILDGKAEMKFNPQKNAGEITLWGANNSNQIAFLGPIDQEYGAGQLTLKNSTGNGEAGLFAFDGLGGQLYLNGDSAINVVAGGDASGKGYVEIANSASDFLAGMLIDEFDTGEIYVRTGGRFRIKNNLGFNRVLIDEDIFSYADDDGSLAFIMGREFDAPKVGFQYMYGQNGFANVFVGMDRNTSGDQFGNIGLIELYDAEANARAIVDGYGNFTGSSMDVRDFNNITRVDVGTVLFDNSGYLDVRGSNGLLNVSLHGQTSGDHGAVIVLDDTGTAQAGMFVDEYSGLGHLFADVKNFRMTHPERPDQEIWYASLEGPEAGAYARGKARLVNGESFVPFPDHYKIVCNYETMTVQLTPRHWDTFGVAVTEITPEGFYVKELKGGEGNFEFDWHATSVRRGFENYEVIKEHADISSSLYRKTGSKIK